MARVVIDPIKVSRIAQKVTVPIITQMSKDIVNLSKRWPRAGNPAWTDSNGDLNRHTKYIVYPGPNPYSVIVNDLDYAAAVHNGTKARIIFPRNHRFMKFAWKRFGGKIVYLEEVKHPATRGSFFISQPAAIVAKRYGAKVSGTLIP